ncbi:hypothetical protein [Mycolicibacterium austroafricanum]|uniref:hypothetical protein n=1 Tax=Mycolicibacterium austroafricanum TaxID=39687 RepID=UPI001CA361EC|nr:hypothetical protein [Mycolicibacterium austroafricanum]QZT64917.1 hypothetical protein JN085_11705 [Mycolicibacterium austroafricanum]
MLSDLVNLPHTDTADIEAAEGPGTGGGSLLPIPDLIQMAADAANTASTATTTPKDT